MLLSLVLGILFAVHAAVGSFVAASQQQWPNTMRRVYRDLSESCSAPEFPCISVQTASTPVLHPGSALIKVSGSTIGHDELTIFKNITLGLDAAGIVVETGESCVRLRKGDRVWANFPWDFNLVTTTPLFEYGSGGMAEYATVVCEYAGIAPSSIDLSLAGTFPSDTLTSLGAFKAAGAPWTSKDFTVLIPAGTGGTGYPGIQLAKLLGATKVVTAAGHDDGVSFVKSLGADVAVDFHKGSVFDAVADRSVDLVYDNLGVIADVPRAMAKLKSPGGMFVSIVASTMNGTSHPPSGVLQMFYDVWSPTERTKIADRLDILAQFIDAGKLRVLVNQTYDFDHVKDAFSKVTHGGLLSRVAVVPKLPDGKKNTLLNVV